MRDDPLDRQPLHALVGTTATGKTALALEVAERAGAEVLPLDSMLVYRGLDVGTAKPTVAERERVPHHLIDLVEPAEVYDVQRYLADARDALSDILRRDGRALFVGGTGFYLAALVRGMFEGPPTDPELRASLERRAAQEGAEAMHQELAAIDPESAARLHANDVRRVVRALEVARQTGRPLSEWQRQWGSSPSERERRARLVGLTCSREELDRRILDRTEAMVNSAWREEALAVRAGSGFGPGAAQALGYAEVLDWADGVLTRKEAVERIALRTRQFGRRQRTWYRKFEITWIEADAEDRAGRALQELGW